MPFIGATYALRALCHTLTPLTTIIKTLYRTPAEMYHKVLFYLHLYIDLRYDIRKIYEKI